MPVAHMGSGETDHKYSDHDPGTHVCPLLTFPTLSLNEVAYLGPLLASQHKVIPSPKVMQIESSDFTKSMANSSECQLH